MPPYHTDFLLNELVWANIKGQVSECLSESLQVKCQDSEKLFPEYSVDKWKKCSDHIVSIENELWKNDALIDKAVDELLFL